jgi:hypothetical protein
MNRQQLTPWASPEKEHLARLGLRQTGSSTLAAPADASHHCGAATHRARAAQDLVEVDSAGWLGPPWRVSPAGSSGRRTAPAPPLSAPETCGNRVRVPRRTARQRQATGRAKGSAYEVTPSESAKHRPGKAAMALDVETPAGRFQMEMDLVLFEISQELVAEATA